MEEDDEGRGRREDVAEVGVGEWVVGMVDGVFWGRYIGEVTVGFWCPVLGAWGGNGVTWSDAYLRDVGAFGAWSFIALCNTVDNTSGR